MPHCKHGPHVGADVLTTQPGLQHSPPLPHRDQSGHSATWDGPGGLPAACRSRGTRAACPAEAPAPLPREAPGGP